jgi:hypothetical protein
MTACVLAAAAGTKAALTNPNRSDILGLNANSDYLQGMRVSLSLVSHSLFAFHSLLLLFFSSTLFLPHYFLFFLASPFFSSSPLILQLFPHSLSPFLRSCLSSFLPSFSPYISLPYYRSSSIQTNPVITSTFNLTNF